MKIINTAKQILSLLIKGAIEVGDLHFGMSYKYVMEKLNIKDEKFFHICMLYLYDGEYLKFISKDDDDVRSIGITAKGIESIEA